MKIKILNRLLLCILSVYLPMQAQSDPRTTRQIVIDIDTTLTTCCAEIDENFIGTFTTIAAVQAALHAGGCTTHAISQADVGTTGFVITISGAYSITEDIIFNPAISAAAITITTDNVILDLQCFSITQGNSTANVDGISIAANSSNVKIQNGKLQSFTRDGVRVASGSTNISYFNTTIEKCLYGIFCLGTLVSPIVETQAAGLDLLGNSTGISLTFVNRALIEECSFFGNASAGIELINSFSNAIDSCSIENTGAATGSACGVLLTNGGNNKVNNCYIDGVSTNDTFVGNSAVGILIGTTENDDIITNNQISNCITTSNAQPFGIEMLYTFTGSATVTSSPQYIQNMVWSPNGNFLLTQGINGEAALVNLKNNQFFNLTTNFSNPYFAQGMAWSPDSSHFAFFEQIYSVATGVPVLVASAPIPANQSVAAIAWSPNGAYISYASIPNPLSVLINTEAIYKFDGSIVTLVAAAATTLPLDTAFLRTSWSPDGNYVAVAGDESFIYQFSGNQLAQTIALGNLTNLVWSPNGQFVLTVVEDGPTASVFRFLGTSLVPVSSITFTPPPLPVDAQWSPDGQFVGVLRGTPGTGVVDFYQFSGNQLTFVFAANLPTGSTAGPSSLNWSLLGNFIASMIIITESTTCEAVIINGLQFPSGTLIQNNEILTIHGPALPAGQPGFSSGRGLSASSSNNLIIQNTTFNSDINYVFVNNIFEQFIKNASPTPSLISNLSFPPL